MRFMVLSPLCTRTVEIVLVNYMMHARMRMHVHVASKIDFILSYHNHSSTSEQ